MVGITLHLQGAGIYPDLAEKDVIHIGEGTSFHLALLRGGMASGKDSVSFRFDLPDGRPVLMQTSLALLTNAVHCLNVAPR
ncbi:MAG: hypothetical protein JWN86_710 [Planctomycetota bacterium]|nr:hypothetical protein [Planctomycetota bacterium]